jgi:hypothetical protein
MMFVDRGNDIAYKSSGFTVSFSSSYSNSGGGEVF